ncbi:MAG: ABC transporter substrate-binding protein [Bacteroidales bacterium]
MNKKNTSGNTIKIAVLKGPSAISVVKLMKSDDRFEIIMKNEPAQVKALILKEDVDIAMVPVTLGSVLYNRGVKYKLAAVPVWGTLYLFGTDTSVHAWNNLKGKRVYMMARGMTPDVIFRYLLEENGLVPGEDVIIDYSFPGHIELTNSIAGGKTGMGVVSEPLVSLAMHKNNDVEILIDLNKAYRQLEKTHENLPMTALLVNESTYGQKREYIEAALKAIQQSAAWVNDSVAEAAKLVVEQEILPDIHVAKESIPRCNIRYIPAVEAKLPVNNFYSLLFRYDPALIGGAMPGDEFYMAFE